MKKIKKHMLFVMLMFMLCANSITTFSYTGPIIEQQNASESQNTQARYPIIEWRYKVEDGKLYKRLFNTTTGEWVGEWEVCP